MELEKFRTRWLRWLGQMLREDRNTWAELHDCNWSNWAYKVLQKHNIDTYITIQSSLSEIKQFYTQAINRADIHDLIRLDNLWCTEQIKKLGL